MNAVVTGGAGFVGSHLCERLLAEGWSVVCVDSLITGDLSNIAGCADDPRFRFVQHDVTEPISLDGALDGSIDWILHLASPASPIDYLANPIETLRTGGVGTLNALELARAASAGFFISSTSEVYGDPQVHPQPETYWGNVNPIGPRSVYDEGKRYGEAATMAYRRSYGLEVRIARIFNTYGERMRSHDGRAVPTFIRQALAGEPVTVHGTGSQTRSLCYVADLVDGIWRLVTGSVTGPVNLGNPDEVTIGELARRICAAVGTTADVVYTDRPEDDPELRRPDITLAQRALGWSPTVPLDEGLERTIVWARQAWGSRPGAAGS